MKELVALWSWRKKFFKKSDLKNSFLSNPSYIKLYETTDGAWLAWRAVPRIEDGKVTFSEGSEPVSVYEDAKLDNIYAQRHPYL
jgi:hypothetical protein